MMISKDKMASAQVLVVGDVMLDRYWYGAVDRISPEAPVPVVRITREEERNGGAANVAYNVVTLVPKPPCSPSWVMMRRATSSKHWWPKQAFSRTLGAMLTSRRRSSCG